MKFDTTENTTLQLSKHPIVKTTERDCPRCDSVLYQNEKEGCYECLNCGYIDCGDH